MRLPYGFTLQEFKPYEWNKEVRQIKDAFNGRIQFGNLAGQDRNMDGILLEANFPLIAGTDLTLTHGLNSVPVGYLVLKNSNGGVVYDGSVAATKTQITLRSTSPSTEALIFILR